MKRSRDQFKKLADRIRDAAQRQIPGGEITNQVRGGTGGVLPPGGNTGSGYTPAAHSTDWADVTGTPTTLAGYGITDAASDAELAAHEADTTSVHGIADTSTLYRAGGTDVALADGGTGASLSDPNADRILFWDDSAGQLTWLTPGTNLTITSTTIDAASGLTNPMTTQDDIIVGDTGGTPARLAKGTDGQVLTVDPTTHHLIWATPSSGGAPTGATYITQTHDSGLSAEQALADLATGILKSTTATGVLSIATGADLPSMVASGGSHSAGAVPDPGGSAGSVKFLREDATWQTPSGTGAPTTVPYITTASDAVLSAEVVIPGLAASQDIAGAGGGGITEEYDTGTTGLTWNTAPAVEDSNTTIKSHLYVKMTAAAERIGTRSWAPGSGAFDARTKISLGSDQSASNYGSGFHIGDSGNSNRLLVNYYMFIAGSGRVDAYTYASGSYTQRGSTWQSPNNMCYLRIVRDGSNNVSFYFSADGLLWALISTLSFTLTVANIGYRTNNGSASACYFASDFLRTNV